MLNFAALALRGNGMSFNRNRGRLLSAVVAAVAAFANLPATAQVYYGGHNLGPDYGAMIRQQQQLMQQQQRQMQSQEQQVIAQVMNNPRFAPMYQQHRMQGGQMSPQQFAYSLAATRWGSREGIAQFRQNEQRNQAEERGAVGRLRAAEAERGQAQTNYMNNQHRNNQEFGRTLQGNSTYTAQNGQNYVLPHTQPGVISRDQNGNAFVMDNRGQYYMQTPYGWQPMRPAF